MSVAGLGVLGSTGLLRPAGSKNNEIFRKWGIKVRRNEDMRDDYVRRARELVEDHLGLELPEVRAEAG